MTMPAEKAALRSELLLWRAAVDPELRRMMSARLADVGTGIALSRVAWVVPRNSASRPSEGGQDGVGEPTTSCLGFASSRPTVASAYHPMRGEADPLPLLASLAEAGIVTALPVTVARAAPLRFLAWRPGEALASGRFGVQEPVGEAPEVVPDILFVPLAGFDGRGFRLGYGAGYYDATLAALRRRRRVLAVGVGFALQEVARVPTEPHDERLDAVVTEHGLHRFGTP